MDLLYQITKRRGLIQREFLEDFLEDCNEMIHPHPLEFSNQGFHSPSFYDDGMSNHAHNAPIDYGSSSLFGTAYANYDAYMESNLVHSQINAASSYQPQNCSVMNSQTLSNPYDMSFSVDNITEQKLLDPLLKLSRIKMNGDLDSYHREFMSLQALVKKENSYLSDAYFVKVYCGGLPYDIRLEMEEKTPQTISEAYAWAQKKLTVEEVCPIKPDRISEEHLNDVSVDEGEKHLDNMDGDADRDNEACPDNVANAGVDSDEDDAETDHDNEEYVIHSRSAASIEAQASWNSNSAHDPQRVQLVEISSVLATLEAVAAAALPSIEATAVAKEEELLHDNFITDIEVVMNTFDITSKWLGQHDSDWKDLTGAYLIFSFGFSPHNIYIQLLELMGAEVAKATAIYTPLLQLKSAKTESIAAITFVNPGTFCVKLTGYGILCHELVNGSGLLLLEFLNTYKVESATNLHFYKEELLVTSMLEMTNILMFQQKVPDYYRFLVWLWKHDFVLMTYESVKDAILYKELFNNAETLSASYLVDKVFVWLIAWIVELLVQALGVAVDVYQEFFKMGFHSQSLNMLHSERAFGLVLQVLQCKSPVSHHLWQNSWLVTAGNSINYQHGFTPHFLFFQILEGCVSFAVTELNGSNSNKALHWNYISSSVSSLCWVKFFVPIMTLEDKGLEGLGNVKVLALQPFAGDGREAPKVEDDYAVAL